MPSTSPWDTNALGHAAGFEGHPEIIKWAVENGCPVDALIESAREGASRGSQPRVLRWLRENGY